MCLALNKVYVSVNIINAEEFITSDIHNLVVPDLPVWALGEGLQR